MSCSLSFCIILIVFLGPSVSKDSGVHLAIQRFDYETRCMTKCLECEKGPNSCTKCTSGFDCCNWACQKCSNQTQCESCKQGFELDPSLNICVFQYSCDSTFCADCDYDKNICTKCEVGYYLNVEMKTCEPCPIKCIQCLNGYSCNQCQERTFWQDGACRSCTENCEKCHNATICESCILGYFINQIGKCQKCIQQCKKCTSKKECLECNAGHYFDQNIKDCLPCVKPCLECKNQTYCISCQPNYYHNDTTGKCLQCNQIHQHCVVCQANQIDDFQESILLHHGGFNKIKDADIKCFQCDVKYYLENGQCKLCPEQCNKCNNSQTCIECSESFFVNNKSICQYCPIFRCYKCLNATECLICSQGTYWNPAISKYQCTKCSLGCSNCDEFGCHNCEAGYYVKNGNCYKCDSSCFRCTNNPFSCQTCLTGYFKTTFSDGHCYKCPQPCAECKNSTFCTRCMPQHYLSKNTCKKCIAQGCDQCKSIESNITQSPISEISIQNTQKCIRCSFGYFLKDEFCFKCFDGCQRCFDSSSCLQCSNRFYLNDNKTKCMPCSQHCLKCNFLKQSFEACIKCQPGFSVDFSSSNCISCMQNCLECLRDSCYNCKEGYYEALTNESVQVCVKCKNPCKDCEDETTCLSCDIGYYLNAVDTCVKCQDGCEECSEEGCFLCQPTYRLNYENLTCSKCKVDKCAKCQSSESVCDTCQDGYQYFIPAVIENKLNGNSLCFRCDQKISGCRKCNSPILCTQCFSGLNLVNSEDGSFSFCDQKPSNSTWQLFIIIGSLALLVVVLIGVIFIQKRKGRKTGKSEEANEKQSLIEENSYSINADEVISDGHLRRSLRSSFGDYQK